MVVPVSKPPFTISCVAVPPAAVTVRLMLAVCVNAPETPVMVTVAVPVVAVELAVKVTTLVEVVGLVPKLAVTPAGRPEADNVTLPVNPFTGVSVMVLVAVELCATETLAGEADKLKSGVVTAAPAKALIMVWPIGLPQPVTKS